MKRGTERTMGQVEGKVALVTGGASGIGAECARTLAREGAKVVVTDIDEREGDGVVRAVAAAGGSALYLRQDVTSEERWIEVVAEVEKRYGGLDILVSNAGIGINVASILDMRLSDWRRQMAINLDGVFLFVKHCIPAMRRAQRGGSIIMMSSVADLRGSATLAGYCATKGGVRLFAKSIAMECAAANDGIRVNSVHPGIIDTPIWSKITREATGMGHNAPMHADQLGKDVPIGFAGSPADIANGVLFLASDASRYMTGSELVIDGGMTSGSVRR